MANVQIVRIPGDQPRNLYLNLDVERDAALLASLRRRQARGELHSVEIAEPASEPAPEEPPAVEVKPVKRTAKPPAESE